MPWARDASAHQPPPCVSILVLVEVLPWDKMAQWWKRAGEERFNPCSGGSIALGKAALTRIFGKGDVSILVLVEVLPWEEAKEALEEDLPTEFQSLFWWKYCPGRHRGQLIPSHQAPGRGERPGAFFMRSYVSILVLVEVLPWDEGENQHGKYWIMFQSLFWWKYCPGLAALVGVTSVTLSFQSLFWWKYCPGGKRDGSNWAKKHGFQSLFWWKYCPGRIISGRGRDGLDAVSILVLVEVLPWVKLSAGLVRFEGERFNPCSGGSIALGLRLRALKTIRLLFQSLFWWKYCPGSCNASAPMSLGCSFNPCSGGSIALGCDGQLQFIVRSQVSILVLVEVLPWEKIGGDAPRGGASFQSLFWWKYCPGWGPTGRRL